MFQFFNSQSNQIFRDKQYICKMNTKPENIFNFLNNFDSSVIQINDYNLISNVPNLDNLANYQKIFFPFFRKNTFFINYNGQNYNSISKLR